VQLVQLVNRDEFDAALTEAAVRSGAQFRDAVRVSGVREEHGAVQLTTDRGIVQARAVVGADGSASRIGNHVGVDCDLVDLGLEVELAAGHTEESWGGRVHLDWGPLPGSYGWVFPKGDRLTVGVIARKGAPEATRAYLRRLITQLGLEDLKVLRESGHLTRCRRPSSPMSRGRVLVAGDAAGFLEPWTREGISFALRSGAAAGRAAAAVARATDDDGALAATDCYRAEMDETLVREMAGGRECLESYVKSPGVFHAALAYTSIGWWAFRKVVRGDTTVARILDRRAVRAALRLITR
jgi:flavin-dependent dehydrogenase